MRGGGLAIPLALACGLALAGEEAVQYITERAAVGYR